MVSVNYFCGSSLNEVAQCLSKDQVMMVKFYPEKAMPVDVVTYPSFQRDIILKNYTVVYVPCSAGYYYIKVIRGDF